jgi:hypothetical protein
VTGQPTDSAAVLAYVHGLMDAERSGERVTIRLGPWSAFLLVGWLQLIVRHPDTDEMHAGVATAFGRQIATWFAGTPGESMLAMAENPAFDIDPATAGPSPAADLAYVRRLRDEQRDGAGAPVVLGVFTAYLLAQWLRMVTEAPHLTPDQRRLAFDIATQLRPTFAGTLGDDLLREHAHDDFPW